MQKLIKFFHTLIWAFWMDFGRPKWLISILAWLSKHRKDL